MAGEKLTVKKLNQGREVPQSWQEKSIFLFIPDAELTSKACVPLSSTFGDLHEQRGACKTRHSVPSVCVCVGWEGGIG